MLDRVRVVAALVAALRGKVKLLLLLPPVGCGGRRERRQGRVGCVGGAMLMMGGGSGGGGVAGGALVVLGVVLSYVAWLGRRPAVVCLRSWRVLLLLLLLVDEPVQVLDVVDGVAEDVHLGHLLDAGRRRDVGLEHVEAGVDGLDPVSLPGVPLGRLGVLLGQDGVTAARVDGHQLSRGHSLAA